MDSNLLIGATFCFLLSFACTLLVLKNGRFRPGSANLVTMVGGFLLLSVFLWQRGQVEGSCPINSLFDVLVFMSWSTVLIYLLVGPPYHLSLMGAFTAPLVLLILGVAQLAPISRALVVVSPDKHRNPWIQFHASLSLVAYGAFALAGIAGLMYLVQNRQLKRRMGGPLLFNLPPITELGIANARLLWLGFGLLTVGFAAGFICRMPVNTLKFFTSAGIWGIYGTMLVLRRIHSLSPRRVAALSMAVLLLLLFTLPIIQHLSIPK